VPTYDFYCVCGWEGESVVPVALRDQQCCPKPGCQRILKRRVSSALFKFAGQVTKGGGPDRFTADMLGVPLKELPDSLKADRPIVT
jgi:hypothetical protein